MLLRARLRVAGAQAPDQLAQREIARGNLVEAALPVQGEALHRPRADAGQRPQPPPAALVIGIAQRDAPARHLARGAAQRQRPPGREVEGLQQRRRGAGERARARQVRAAPCRGPCGRGGGRSGARCRRLASTRSAARRSPRRAPRRAPGGAAGGSTGRGAPSAPISGSSRKRAWNGARSSSSPSAKRIRSSATSQAPRVRAHAPIRTLREVPCAARTSTGSSSTCSSRSRTPPWTRMTPSAPAARQSQRPARLELDAPMWIRCPARRRIEARRADAPDLTDVRRRGGREVTARVARRRPRRCAAWRSRRRARWRPSTAAVAAPATNPVAATAATWRSGGAGGADRLDRPRRDEHQLPVDDLLGLPGVGAPRPRPSSSRSLAHRSSTRSHQSSTRCTSVQDPLVDAEAATISPPIPSIARFIGRLVSRIQPISPPFCGVRSAASNISW